MNRLNATIHAIGMTRLESQVEVKFYLKFIFFYEILFSDVALMRKIYIFVYVIRMSFLIVSFKIK